MLFAVNSSSRRLPVLNPLPEKPGRELISGFIRLMTYHGQLTDWPTFTWTLDVMEADLLAFADKAGLLHTKLAGLSQASGEAAVALR